MSKNARRSLLPLLLILALEGGFAPLAISSPVEVKAILEANMATYDGYCPTVILFDGKIRVSAACTVQYKFVRSDGKSVFGTALVFSGPGEKAVNSTWTLKGTTSGWMAIEVTAPVATSSAHASFSVTCKPNPKITDVQEEYVSGQNPVLHVTGQNFGTSQGNLNVAVDDIRTFQKPGWSVLSWSNTKIDLQSKDLLIWIHYYRFSIMENANIVSDYFKKQFIYKSATGPSPAGGVVGTAFTIPFYLLQSYQGSLNLRLGGIQNVIITSWAAPVIHCQIPLMLPGTYDLVLRSGADVCSPVYKLTVVKN